MKLYNYINKVFAIEEIAESKVLQVFSAAILVTFLVTFFGWTHADFTSRFGQTLCLPHLIEKCSAYKNILELIPLPYNYSQSAFYVLLFSLIILAFYYLYTKKIYYVWLIIGILWFYKLFIVYGFGSGNFDYYDVVLIAVFLISKNKLYWLRVFFLILYFLSSSIKIHSGWILGTYFTSLETGLPLITNNLTPIATNIVIISQMIFCWFLIREKRTYLFKISFFFFLFFHLYSGILVEYRYMVTSIPFLVILFWLPEDVPYKKNKKIFPLLFFVILLQLQLIAIRIPGDQKLTLEGNDYGLYMFEANHQCIATYTTKYKDGESAVNIQQNSDARNRCDPYEYVYKYKKNCLNPKVETIKFTFDHSINGDPFYRIVDSNDLCKLTYIPFKHNTWIKTENDNPVLVGYPFKNFYSVNVSREGEIQFGDNNYVILPGLEKNSKPELNTLQKFIAMHLSEVSLIYWILWIVELCSIVYFFFYKEKNPPKNSS